MKRCYYEVLELDRKATAAEVKTSYRKMALKYHPDKNPEEDAKQRFVQINEAYNVLSDVNERTWYDNNREKLLFNKEDMSKEDIQQYTFGFNIWGYFTTSCFSGFQDDEGGFYAIYRDIFQKIKTEETKAFNSREDLTQEFRKLQGFGDSKTTQEKVLRFYQDWENFATYKTFIWSQQYDTRDAGNRWVRREMQKQNKKTRQTQKKNYIKTIKDLVAYVKKRDPRFRQYLMKQKQEQQRKAKQKIQKQKLKKIEKEQMKIVRQKLEEQRFRQIQEYYKKQNQQLNSTHKVHDHKQHLEVQHQSQYYCEICQKEFKSENQLRNHQKSKQHKQMVKNLEKQVMLKEQLVQQAQQVEVSETPSVETVQPQAQSPKKRNKKKKNKNNQINQKQQSQEEQKEQEKPPAKVQQTKKQVNNNKINQSQSESDDEDHFMNTLLNNRKPKTKVEIKQQKNQPQKNISLKQEPKKKAPPKQKVQESQSSQQQEQKPGKAKLKKMKKAQQQKGSKVNPNKCNVCNQTFASKTKLFDHVKKQNHAQAK